MPLALGQLTSLAYLNWNTCGFNGPLPASFGNLEKLKFLDVSFNNLDGALPKELGSATILTTLGLAYNEFDGPIPSEFGLLTNLKEFVIQNTNLLVGVMPQETCTLRQEGILGALQLHATTLFVHVVTVTRFKELHAQISCFQKLLYVSLPNLLIHTYIAINLFSFDISINKSKTRSMQALQIVLVDE